MEKESEKFYKTFCKMTQSKSGMWEQRFYTDGSMAPQWGYQVDETASVIYGIYNHYEHTKSIKFLKDTLRMCENAIKYLKKYVQNVLDEKKEEYKSYDLWEENEGIHTYSLAAIFSSFDKMIKIYKILKPEYKENRLKIEKIDKEENILNKYLVEIKEYILKRLYDNNKKSFIRNEDGKIDISILGIVTPFNIYSAKDKKIQNTIEQNKSRLKSHHLETTLVTPVNILKYILSVFFLYLDTYIIHAYIYIFQNQIVWCILFYCLRNNNSFPVA